MKSRVSRSALATATIWHLPPFAGVCVRLPAFADFVSAMELEMALDARDLRGFFVEHRN
jgi:hypothetical protein